MDRQNVVVKLWRKCITGHDEVIGFVSIPLPAQSITKNEYEMSDLCASEQAPLITVSAFSLINVRKGWKKLLRVGHAPNVRIHRREVEC